MAKARLVSLTAEQLLMRRMQALYDSVKEITRGQLSPSLPLYDPDFPVDAVDGQVCIQGGVPYYFYSGTWNTFGGGVWTDISSEILVSRISDFDSNPTILVPVAKRCLMGTFMALRLQIQIDDDAGDGITGYVITGFGNPPDMTTQVVGHGVCYKNGLGQQAYNVQVVTAAGGLAMSWDGSTQLGNLMGPSAGSGNSPQDWDGSDTILNGFAVLETTLPA